eukprot:s454_g8.t1
MARTTSTYEVAGNQQVSLADAGTALNKNIGTTASLDSYDSAVEDAQRREPKLTKQPFTTPQKPLPASAEKAAMVRARPLQAAHLTSPPADKAPSPENKGPARLNSQSSSPGPSASDVSPPAPGTKGKDPEVECVVIGPK